MWFQPYQYYVPTSKLSKKMGLMTLNDPTAQCQSPYSLGSLGSAKTEGRNSVDSMTLYNPSTTTQFLLPYSPRNGLNGKQTLYAYQHLKQFCHQGTHTSVLMTMLMIIY